MKFGYFTAEDARKIAEEISKLRAKPSGRVQSGQDQRTKTAYYFYPVIMVQTGGSAGSSSQKCDWTYTLKLINDSDDIIENYNPDYDTGDGWIRRPATGKVTAATRGIAYYDEGTYRIAACNEAYEELVFDCQFTQVGGTDGDASNKASWTYNIADSAGNAVGSNVNPDDGNNGRFRRPAVGSIVPATWGLCRWEGSQLIVLDCNEVELVEACDGSAGNGPYNP